MVKRVVVHLRVRIAVASYACLLSFAVQTLAVFLSTLVNRDGNIAVKATLLSCSPIACTNDGQVESSDGKLERGKHFKTYELKNR